MTIKQVMHHEGGKPVKIWTADVEGTAARQLENLSHLPFIHKHVAVMPDVHAGIGSTVGTVIPTKGAIIPAAVGVDIGCGMMAIHTTLRASDLPDNLSALRTRIERSVPHGFVTTQDVGHVKGGFESFDDSTSLDLWGDLADRLRDIDAKHPTILGRDGGNKAALQLGSLGGGNHFIEVCLDKKDEVWIMLHSGSRGVGNKIGRYFIALAREEMRRHFINLPDADLAYLVEGSDHFKVYVEAMLWAQDYAYANRIAMMRAVRYAVAECVKPFDVARMAVNCHHNYCERENHYGENVWVTRKGAVRARRGDLGIIPGSMGARSFIVRGLGNPESFDSCSHGAGRRMSRTEARKRFTAADLQAQTSGVECRKDEGVIDEIPSAYKDIDEVMANQTDLVEVVAELRQVLCVKG